MRACHTKCASFVFALLVIGDREETTHVIVTLEY